MPGIVVAWMARLTQNAPPPFCAQSRSLPGATTVRPNGHSAPMGRREGVGLFLDGLGGVRQAPGSDVT